MSILDLVFLGGYFLSMIGLGAYFMKKQKNMDDYFVGGRRMTASHIGMSVVATDVGGGFSIGLGGLGFAMGLSASWLLFTGLIGAWLSAVLLIPKVRKNSVLHQHRSFPDFLASFFGKKVGITAAFISALGYMGFTGSQLLAGGKLFGAVFDMNIQTAVILMSFIIIIYTAFGGLQAVIYTDTIQWVILFFSLAFIALPLGYFKVGGLDGLKASLPEGHLSLWGNLTWRQFFSWMITIIPIWFIAMTLYQRIHASKDLKTAQRAWFFAGLLEYPFMAFIGAILGMFARVLFPEVDQELGLPLLIKNIMPVGLTGLVVAAYFAAIMSTADSCLIASVGNMIDDIAYKGWNIKLSHQKMLKISRFLTVFIGLIAVLFALYKKEVIDSILISYSIMVCGLFLPTVAALMKLKIKENSIFISILLGGGSQIILTLFPSLSKGIEPIFIGLTVSFITISIFYFTEKFILKHN